VINAHNPLVVQGQRDWRARAPHQLERLVECDPVHVPNDARVRVIRSVDREVVVLERRRIGAAGPGTPNLVQHLLTIVDRSFDSAQAARRAVAVVGARAGSSGVSSIS
jgi:hypothetical protein